MYEYSYHKKNSFEPSPITYKLYKTQASFACPNPPLNHPLQSRYSILQVVLSFWGLTPSIPKISVPVLTIYWKLRNGLPIEVQRSQSIGICKRRLKEFYLQLNTIISVRLYLYLNVCMYNYLYMYACVCVCTFLYKKVHIHAYILYDYIYIYF